MKSLNRDKQPVYVSLYSERVKVVDSNNLWTGEWRVKRATPFKVFPTMTSESGYSKTEFYGIAQDYSRVLTFDSDLGITESAVFWIEREPLFDASGNLVVDSNGDPSVAHDYEISYISESLNVVRVAVKKVVK